MVVKDLPGRFTRQIYPADLPGRFTRQIYPAGLPGMIPGWVFQSSSKFSDV
ncbi:hypothetical protein [Microbulbifer sp. THAF38]|uniref:hypothetical protein n=1 Tax=Microbulbifer sp. THAF38 TaxID=2587856 RepID=UPI001561D88D|nr:hypothetical protein [Microbulbifer sp. THAF38]